MESEMKGIKTYGQIGEEVDSWIAEEELPTRARLTIERRQKQEYLGIWDNINNEWLVEPMDEDEIEAYKEFRRWFVNKELDLIKIIPVKDNDEFYIPFENDDSISFAFSSMDFRRLVPEFNKYQYKLRKIYERVKDLADTHSAISDSEGKENTRQKYIGLVEREFRDNAKELLESYKKYPHLVNKEKLFQRIQENNNRILKCKGIWDRYAYLK